MTCAAAAAVAIKMPTSKYPPAEPGALGCEPLKAAVRDRWCGPVAEVLWAPQFLARTEPAGQFAKTLNMTWSPLPR
jgi:hypothetical protein